MRTEHKQSSSVPFWNGHQLGWSELYDVLCVSWHRVGFVFTAGMHHKAAHGSVRLVLPGLMCQIVRELVSWKKKKKRRVLTSRPKFIFLKKPLFIEDHTNVVWVRSVHLSETKRLAFRSVYTNTSTDTNTSWLSQWANRPRRACGFIRLPSSEPFFWSHRVSPLCNFPRGKQSRALIPEHPDT